MTKAARQPLGFAIVSAVCLGTHNIVMIVADAFGGALWAAVLTSYLIVVLIGYAGHSLVTFNQRMKLPGLGRYALAMAANIPSAFILIWIGRSAFGMPMWIAAPVATAGTLAINFLASRWAITGCWIAEKD